MHFRESKEDRSGSSRTQTRRLEDKRRPLPFTEALRATCTPRAPLRPETAIPPKIRGKHFSNLRFLISKRSAPRARRAQSETYERTGVLLAESLAATTWLVGIRGDASARSSGDVSGEFADVTVSARLHLPTGVSSSR